MAIKNTMNSGDYSNSFNRFVFNEVPQNTTCLDVGCWNGNLGKALIKEKNCTVDGIDFKEEVLKKTLKNGYRKTYKINFNNESYSLSMITRKYDVIICADILEHLIDGQQVLTELKKHLAKNGIIIISLPNVAFILNRLLLLLGNWDYREFGTLDKTHIKFFTLKNAVKMTEKAGLKAQKIIPYNQFGVLNKLPFITKLFPGALAYQLMIVAKAK